jgi:hypothetical protein
MKTLSHFFKKALLYYTSCSHPVFFGHQVVKFCHKKTHCVCVCVCVCVIFIYVCDVTKVPIIHKMNESNLAIKSVKGN